MSSTSKIQSVVKGVDSASAHTYTYDMLIHTHIHLIHTHITPPRARTHIHTHTHTHTRQKWLEGHESQMYGFNKRREKDAAGDSTMVHENWARQPTGDCTHCLHAAGNNTSRTHKSHFSTARCDAASVGSRQKMALWAGIDAALDDAPSHDDNTQDQHATTHVSSLVAETISDENVERAVVDRRTIDLFSFMTGAAAAGSTAPISLADSHAQSGGASAQAVCSQDAKSVDVAAELSGKVDTKTFVAVPSLNLGFLNDFMNQVKEVKRVYDSTA